jgi:hypothetical protein
MWCCDYHHSICPDLAVFVNLCAVFLVPSYFGSLLGCHLLPETVRLMVQLPLLTRQRRGSVVTTVLGGPCISRNMVECISFVYHMWMSLTNTNVKLVQSVAYQARVPGGSL